jgi:NADPH:quinone reductase-like Zn-dependent oxidoreductase
MKAFVLYKYGKNEKLHLTDIPQPAVGENDVLVEVHAAGVNHLDLLVKNGAFKAFLKYRTPFALGHDVAGKIVKVGTQVKKFAVGDEVYARPRDYRVGSFAEYISIHEDDVAFTPKNLTMEEAASIPLVGLTIWQSLIEKMDLKPGQKIFIQAGSGGVGSLAIQLAKHLGASVATTTSVDNLTWVKQLGADVVVDYKKEDFTTILIDYDAVLHSNRDPTVLADSLKILKPGGVLVSLSGPPTPEFARELALPWYLQLVTYFLSRKTRRLAQKHDVRFSFLFMRAEGKQLAKITSLIESGVVKPVIDRVFPFAETNEGLSYVESGRSKGKVVIKVK